MIYLQGIVFSRFPHIQSPFIISLLVDIDNLSALYSDRESNPDLIFRRDLFYPLNYQSKHNQQFRFAVA